jgi:uncharacterized protein YcbK (DUF882 family)
VSRFDNKSRHTARRYYLDVHGPAYELSPHFRLVEMASKDGSNEVMVHGRLIELLETIRSHFGGPVMINSGYRSRPHNRAIGGARHSRHLHGLAADVVVWDEKGRLVHPDRVAEVAESLGVGGLGRYAHFCHLDVQGHGRRWTG